MTQYYIGFDVHQKTTVAAVLDANGKQTMNAVIETKVGSLTAFLKGLGGNIELTFEEGTQANWLYEILTPLVKKLIVCDPRRNKLIGDGNKNDRIDAQKLAFLLRAGSLTPTYHGDNNKYPLKEIVRCYNGLVQDVTRIKNRIKAVFRGRGIGCAGEKVYKPEKREEFLSLLNQAGLRFRAKKLLEELDYLEKMRAETHQEMIRESKKHPDYKRLLEIPMLGPIRVSQLLAVAVTPHRFRTKRQFWSYCGLAVVTRSSSDFQFLGEKLKRTKKAPLTRGLNPVHNRHLKQVFKSAAFDASFREPFKPFYERDLNHGTKPELARLNLARKIAAITLRVWKKGEKFDEAKLNLSNIEIA